MQGGAAVERGGGQLQGKGRTFRLSCGAPLSPDIFQRAGNTYGPAVAAEVRRRTPAPLPRKRLYTSAPTKAVKSPRKHDAGEPDVKLEVIGGSTTTPRAADAAGYSAKSGLPMGEARSKPGRNGVQRTTR